MSKMKNYMMDVEDFCNGYFFDAISYDIEEVIEDVGMYFKSDVATKYAREYLTTQLDEI
jgi:hypothetical protein